MISRVKVVLLLLSVIAVAQADESRPAGRIDQIVVPANSLQNNKLGDSTAQEVVVYLPRGYAEQTARRYPALYLLHGFSLRSVLNDWKEVIAEAMDWFIAEHPDKAFIVVIPNGSNKVDGGFYVDSEVGGNWDQYVSKDLVGYIDSHYRTIADRRSRAIAGHSMGGFGALRLLMLHSETYATAYAMSACCLDLEADLTETNPAWKEVLRMRSIPDIQAAAQNGEFWPTALAALAIALSPDPKAPISANLPYREAGGKTVAVPETVARWRSMMPLNMIATHESDLRKAAGIALDFGYEDEFSHIPLTSERFGRELFSLHIPVLVEGYHGDHNNGVPARIGTRVIPYIAEHLQFQ